MRTLVRFRIDPQQCEEIKYRLEGARKCPADQWRDPLQNNECTDVCLAGQYRDEVTRICTDGCPAGQYRVPCECGCRSIPDCMDEFALPWELLENNCENDCNCDGTRGGPGGCGDCIDVPADTACPAGQYRASGNADCTHVPADTACDVGQYRGEADGDCFDVPADTSADLQTAQAALQTAQAALAAANTAAVELAAEVEAEKGIAAVIAAEVKAEKDALVLALQAAEAALAASVANTCPLGQYRAEAGGDCKSVTERLWSIIKRNAAILARLNQTACT